MQHLLDQADALEELRPIKRRDQAQGADEARHEGLFAGLVSSIRPNRFFDRLAPGGQRRVEFLPQDPSRGLALARPLQQSDHERRVNVVRPGPPACGIFERGGEPIGLELMGTALRQQIGPRPQVVEQRQLQRARPGPQLAHRQRRDGLECRDEPVQALRIQAAGAAPDQLERHRVDAWKPGELVGRDPRQPPVERRRQIVADVAGGRRDDVEVVEQPLGRRRRLLAGRASSVRATYTPRKACMCPSRRRRCAAPLTRPRMVTVSSAARRRACSSSGSIPSSSIPPSANGPAVVSSPTACRMILLKWPS